MRSVSSFRSVLAVVGTSWAMATSCTCTSGTATLDGGQTTGSGSGSGGGTSGGSSGGAGGSSNGAGSVGGNPTRQQFTPSGSPTLGDGGGFGVGIQRLPDGGGITLGKAVNFSSYFAYVSNSAQAAGSSYVSRVDTQTGKEQARYPSVVPLDNAGKNLCTAGQAKSCLLDLGATYYDNAPSRTVVDLNGGVFVANRGQCDWATCDADEGSASYIAHNPDGLTPSLPMIGAVQGSVTYIANRIDHPEQCSPRCQHRQNWVLPDGGPAIFSSGITLAGVGSLPATEVLSPSAGGGAQRTLQSISPDVVAHVCLDGQPHDPTDVTDPTNYDDCALFSIPLGAPNGYEQATGQSQFADRFAPRGLAISKNCGALGGSQACDLYVGLTEPAAESSVVIHLGFQNNFQPVATIDTGLTNYGLYGAAIDCDGLLWAGHGSNAVAVDTNSDQLASGWAYRDDQGHLQRSNLIKDTAATNTCNAYGLAVDLQGHLWSGGITNSSGTGAGACAFDYGSFLNTPSLHDGSLALADAQKQINGLFHRFPIGHSYPSEPGRGIVVDDQNIAYTALAGGPAAAVALDINGGGSGCGVMGDSHCHWLQDGTALNTHLSNAWGIDLDQDGNPIVSTRSTGVLGLSAADGSPLPIYQNADQTTGLKISEPTGGDDLYTYSDFTGYALRHITQPSGVYEEIFQGCPPGNTVFWEQLVYAAQLPMGASLSFQIDTSNDPAAFTSQGPFVGSWSCSSASSCPSPAMLVGLGDGNWARVTVKLSGPNCALNGSPVLEDLQLAFQCIPSEQH